MNRQLSLSCILLFLAIMAPVIECLIAVGKIVAPTAALFALGLLLYASITKLHSFIKDAPVRKKTAVLRQILRAEGATFADAEDLPISKEDADQHVLEHIGTDTDELAKRAYKCLAKYQELSAREKNAIQSLRQTGNSSKNASGRIKAVEMRVRRESVKRSDALSLFCVGPA